MSDPYAPQGLVSSRRRRRLVPPVDARARAVIAVLLAAAPFVVWAMADAVQPQSDRPEPVDLPNGETAIDPDGGADDADRARRQAEVVEEHSTPADDPAER